MLSVLVSREEILSKLFSLIKKQLPAEEANLIIAFAEQYYINVSLEALNEHTIPNLYAALLSQWHLLYQRKKGETKVRVFNPNLEQDGWQSTHTIVEVATDDMPFLVDSVRMEIHRQGFSIYFAVHLGAMKLCRNKEHEVIKVLPLTAPPENCQLEAPIYIEVDKQTEPEILKALEDGIFHVLSDVRLAVEDWRKMKERMSNTIADLQNNPPPFDQSELSESIAFLEWLNDDHFTYLGCRDYDLVNINGDMGLQLVKNSGLGVLRLEEKSKTLRLMSSLPPAAREIATQPRILVISKTNTKSTVHRPVFTDYIGIKRFNNLGMLVGEHRFIGLFTHTAYKSYPQAIPLLRQKIDTIVKKSKLSPRGHSGKELMDILASLPRDDLFQASTDELTDLALGILHIQDRPQIRVFIRRDAYHRFISCLVFIPQEQLNPQLKEIIQDILSEEFKALEISSNILYSDTPLARMDFLIRTDPKSDISINIDAIQKKLIIAARSWKDEQREKLLEHFGEEKGFELYRRYAKAFSESYKEDFFPEIAIYDIEHIEKLSESHVLEMNLYRPVDAKANELRFKLFRYGQPIILSEALPMLENMGLRVIDESPYEITFKDGTKNWLHDFGVTYQGTEVDISRIKETFEEAFFHIWMGDAENDGFNRLVLSSELRWCEVVILRAYAKYLRQIGFTFSQPYIESTLSKNPFIAKQIIELFMWWFDPEKQKESANTIPEIDKQLQTALEAVTNLDEDRILRRFIEVVRATLRTNYFQKNKEGESKLWLSLKLNSAMIADMPLPKPLYEIFVYSPRVEGIHLRAAKVARGGIRWSDRPEDFRTEVLGLMKAQQVKNALIVPSGAKGGFYPKLLPEDATRDAMMEEGINCYQTFIRGLLDLTDNLVAGEVVHPANTVRYDDDDTYLVVAADKGTATFSDIANNIAAEYHFWLGDAFASGGSAGYDHKKIGITARGAWESVKRHFCVLKIDPDQQDFTVVGIGDMAGDVFGNGMLQSRHIKLVAAFNHAHIFLDPSPDAAISFQERERLFHLPRSSWTDYNPELISPGGGVFKRSAKSIPISFEVKKLLNITEDFLEPNTLIRFILMAEVDLLWNGGIGTYVKAIEERNIDVGDRTNDAVRINGGQLRCRSVGEGGNLGFTQLGRVEYALKGGLIYTDFIDNSGGVDCSDHEVNCKILLNAAIVNGEMTFKERNELLFAMTSEIADLVLQDNYGQTRAIDFITMRAMEEFELYRTYLHDLENAKQIDRVIEFLPEDKILLERKLQGKALCSPEIAILFAYTKMTIKAELLQSNIFDDPYLSQFVELAFPVPLRQRFRGLMDQHSLRKEIIATQLTNAMVNDMGISFVHRMHTETDAIVPAIVRAYSIANKIFNMRSLIEKIETLNYKIDTNLKYHLIWQISRLVRRGSHWFLRNHKEFLADVAASIARFEKPIAELSKDLPNFVVGFQKEQWDSMVNDLSEQGVPENIAELMTTVRYQYSLLDIVEASLEYELPPKQLTAVYFALGEQLEFSWLREQISMQPVENYWDALARVAMTDDLDTQQRKLAVAILQGSDPAMDAETLLEQWIRTHPIFYGRWKQLLAELRANVEVKYMMLSVVVRELVELVRVRVKRRALKNAAKRRV
jgi:glutamate dehydrogenase